MKKRKSESLIVFKLKPEEHNTKTFSNILVTLMFTENISRIAKTRWVNEPQMAGKELVLLSISDVKELECVKFRTRNPVTIETRE